MATAPLPGSASSSPTPARDRISKPIVLFVTMSRRKQAWEAVGGAVVTGALSGLLIGVAWWGYVLNFLLAFIGGFPAGSQHRTLLGALARGFVGGTVWAIGLLVVSGLTGLTPTVPLPQPEVAFLPWGFVPASVVAVISWTVTRTKRRDVAEYGS